MNANTFNATHTLTLADGSVIPVMRDPELIYRPGGDAFVIVYPSSDYSNEYGVYSFEFRPEDESDYLSSIPNRSAQLNLFGAEFILVRAIEFRFTEDIPVMEGLWESITNGRRQRIPVPLSMIELV